MTLYARTMSRQSVAEHPLSETAPLLLFGNTQPLSTLPSKSCHHSFLSSISQQTPESHQRQAVIMSTSRSTFSSSSSYVSFSSSSSSTINGHSSGHSYSQQTSTDPRGTTTRTTSSQIGRPTVEQVRHYDNHGRELLTAPHASSANINTNSNNNQRRIQDFEVEDVTDQVDAETKYKEAMEDEYAKREGGA